MVDISRTVNTKWHGEPDFSRENIPLSLFDPKASSSGGRLFLRERFPDTDNIVRGSFGMRQRPGDFVRPWNAQSGKGSLAKDIPPETLWAYDPRGVHQVGCLCCSGFRVDYIGMIFADDLNWIDPNSFFSPKLTSQWQRQ
jgi:hypothetical protein